MDMENSTNDSNRNGPKFTLGTVVATNHISASLLQRDGARAWITDCLRRHVTGDWGDVDPHDAALNTHSANDEAITAGDRVLSAYPLPERLQSEGDPDRRIWIITSTEAWDADTPMRATTILWPSDY